jgi:DNA-binding NtrC family response regulator
MSLRAPAVPTVLVVDRDESIRQMLAVILGRAGFAVTGVADDGTTALPEREFDVIVRDANLGVRERTRTLQELERTAPELLSRTVITTTAPEPLAKRAAAERVFAVVRKPFDIDALVGVVTECAECGRRRAARVPATKPRRIDRRSLQRFLRSVPTLRQLLGGEETSSRELLLRGEMRRAVLELAALFSAAAKMEANAGRAAELIAASREAAELGGRGAPASAPRNDH